jgi:hypothetical protein
VPDTYRIPATAEIRLDSPAIHRADARRVPRSDPETVLAAAKSVVTELAGLDRLATPALWASGHQSDRLSQRLAAHLPGWRIGILGWRR